MCCDIRIWRFQNILLYSKAIKHNKNWDFCTFSIDAFDFLFWPSPMEILQIRGRLTSPWQKGPSDNLCLCHRCNRKEVFSQKLKVSAPMVVTSTSTQHQSRKVQFRHVLSEIHGNHCPIAHRYEQTSEQPDLGGSRKVGKSPFAGFGTWRPIEIISLRTCW